MFAAYNRWANSRVYEAASELTDEEYRRDVGAFFRSLHGTLNHLLATDRIWMKRFTGEGEAPNRLDAIVHEDFPTLRAAREAEENRAHRLLCRRADGQGPDGPLYLYDGDRHADRVATAGAGTVAPVQPSNPSSRTGAHDPDGA